MPTNEHPVAIIGAGIAGLACARRLQAAGIAVEVIDKNRGPGGRCDTLYGDGWQADHGAQYFTARDERFRAAVEAWRRNGIVAEWQARIVAFDGKAFSPVSNGETRFVGTPDMSVIGRHLSAGLPLRYDSRVTALRRAGEHWIVETSPGETAGRRYSAVIVALPAPQAAALLADVAPPLAATASRCAMRASRALILRYEVDPGLPFDAAFVNAGVLSWVARDTSKPDRPQGHTWVLHAPDEGEDGIEAAMIEAFMHLGAPRPTAVTPHSWRFAQGASSCARQEVWLREQCIGLAGDWLSGGRLEGAWLSGQRTAAAVLEMPT